MLEYIEKRISALIIQIKNDKITPKDSGIGKLFTKLKTIDEPSYDKFLFEYKKVLNDKKK